MGAFDDLIPEQNRPQPGAFDDLIPGATSAAQTSFGPAGFEQPQFEQGQPIGELFSGAARATPLTEELPEADFSNVFAGEDASVVARIAPQLLTATDPQEFASIAQSISPNIAVTFNLDAQGNPFPILTNRKTGAVGQVNRPGLSFQDVRQGAGLAAAFTPAGRTASLPLLAARGAATQTAIEGAQVAEGGEFNPEDVAIAGAALPAGQVIGERVVAPIARAVAQPVIDISRRAIQNLQSRRLLGEAAPTVETLRSTARELYGQVDEIGARVRNERFSRLAQRLRAQARELGFNARIQPRVNAALNDIEANLGENIPVSELEILRRVMQRAGQSTEEAERNLAGNLIETMDDFILGLDENALIGGTSAEVGTLLRDARGLWRRAKKSELLDDAFERARNQASGFENGLRTQFRRILNSEKLSRGFRREELNAIRQVVRGGRLENTAKLLGKLGVSEQQAQNLLLPGLGVAAGASVGGPAGAIAVPAIGQVSRSLAQRLTRRNAEFANAVVRAGNNGQAITRAYLRNTPTSRRSAEELSELLLARREVDFIDLEPLVASSNRLISDAAFIASGILQSREGAQDVIQAATAAPEEFRQ